MQQTPHALVEAVGVRKRFGALTVIDGVDFVVHEGGAVGIVGPNGAGKTTLLNVISGALRADAGAVRLGGVDVTRAGAAKRCRLGIGRAHQIPKPFTGMTVFENVFVGATAGARRGGQAACDVSTDALAACGLIHVANRRAESLGLLDRKRLEMARALATAPRLLLLDEIGAGLTDAEAAVLLETIAGVRARGIAIVWIEHVVHMLVQAIDRLVCMDAGRVLAEGDPATVMSDARVVDAYLGTRIA
ncbi:MAG TPA: ATP-binding cassette domain-containing protein [Gaiellales bacterium]|jgi:branched-chain amino acid transport system ATP-binding protein